MKHPFWILNSALLFLFLVALGFIFFSRERLPYREDLEPEETKIVKREVSTINIRKIYEDDLFDTFEKIIPKRPEPEPIKPVPEPPPPEEPKKIEKEEPQFLDPLKIELKGITVISNDDTKNRAIIEDTETKTEKIYKVGDKIEDAQLRRIFKNKVIFIRSNGQQEVLYLREKDAKLDPMYGLSTDWEEIIQQAAENNFVINPKKFIERIKNLSHLIDVLDLTTVYKQGKSIGLRVGAPPEHSLAKALGLNKGDIIVMIDERPTTNTAQRFKIYKEIISGKKEVVQVQLMRDNNEISIKYTLEEPKKITNTKELSSEKIKEEQLKALQKKHKFAPTLHDIRLRERQNLQKGSAISKPVGPRVFEK